MSACRKGTTGYTYVFLWTLARIGTMAIERDIL